jgi:hypothetical protein
MVYTQPQNNSGTHQNELSKMFIKSKINDNSGCILSGSYSVIERRILLLSLLLLIERESRSVNSLLQISEVVKSLDAGRARSELRMMTTSIVRGKDTSSKS